MVASLGNKLLFYDRLQRLGLLSLLPTRYETPESAYYPSILKRADNSSLGKEVFN